MSRRQTVHRSATGVGPETALADALRRRFPDDVAASRLALSAYDVLRRNDLSVTRATPVLAEVLRGDADLFAACATAYLRVCAADMRGQSLIGLVQEGRGDHDNRDQSDQSQEADAGQGACDSSPAGLTRERLPASSSPIAGRGGHSLSASAKGALPSPPARLRGDLGQSFSALHTSPAPVVAKPQRTPRTAEASASIQAVISRSILDTYRVRDGRAIGDLPWRDLTALALTNEREATVLRHIYSHVINARGNDLVRDVVSAAVVEAAIAEAEEDADVAA